MTYVPTSSYSRKINYSRTTITVGKSPLNDKNYSRESRNVVIPKSIKVLGLSSKAGPFPLRKMFLADGNVSIVFKSLVPSKTQETFLFEENVPAVET